MLELPSKCDKFAVMRNVILRFFVWVFSPPPFFLLVFPPKNLSLMQTALW